MGKIGTTELLVVLAIVLVIFGPKALPKLGRSLGKTLGSFRKGMNDSADDDDDEEEVVVKKKKKKPVAKKADDEEDEEEEDARFKTGYRCFSPSGGKHIFCKKRNGR